MGWPLLVTLLAPHRWSTAVAPSPRLRRPMMSPRSIPLDTAVTAPRPGVTGRLHLSASGVSVVLDVTDGRVPEITHWGAALGALEAAGLDAVCEAAVDVVPQNAVDVPVRVGIIPQQADGWIGRPGLAGARADGSGWVPRLVTRSITVDGEQIGSASCREGAWIAGVAIELRV